MDWAPVVVVEMAEFSRQAKLIFSADEAAALISFIAYNPSAGVVMRGTGGVRKLRWARRRQILWDEIMSETGESILRGAKDALAYARGDKRRGRATTVFVPERVDAKATRKRLGLTQTAFAARFGVSVGTLRDWEQNRRQPEGPARVLLAVIDREPEAVERALAR